MESLDIPWQSYLSSLKESHISGHFWRTVTSTGSLALTRLVDSLEEQRILDSLLNPTQPLGPTSKHHLHPLLAEPFQSYPLPWGSRYGGPYQSGLIYGSIERETSLAETAYYRLLFWSGMTQAPASSRLLSQHIVFSAAYSCQPAVRLHEKPFRSHHEALADPLHYQTTQALSVVLRNTGILGIEYPSARCPNFGTNVALFSPRALTASKPGEQQLWVSEVTSNQVLFSGEGLLFRFSLSDFTEHSTLIPPR